MSNSMVEHINGKQKEKQYSIFVKWQQIQILLIVKNNISCRRSCYEHENHKWNENVWTDMHLYCSYLMAYGVRCLHYILNKIRCMC